MTNAFDANIPKRKPRTRLGGILADVDAQVRETRLKSLPPLGEAEAVQSGGESESFGLELAVAVEGSVRAELPLVDGSADGLAAELQKAHREGAAASTAAAQAPRTAEPPGEDELRAGQARIAELRARLERASSSRTRALEPAAAAGRIRDTVAALRTQLQRTAQDRAELLEALRDTRRDLVQAQRDIETLRSERDESCALAAQQREVAEELLGESEALVQERDAALRRIQELRSLDSDQGALLEQLSARLAEREASLGERERELAETREALSAVEGEGELMQLRLDELQAENRRLHERVAQLEADMGSAASARDALLEIQRLVEALPSPS
jgi:chromosome segregation ATPase